MTEDTNMMRKIIYPTQKEYTLQLPKEYLNQRIEILVLPYDEINEPKTQDDKEFMRATPGLFAYEKIDPVKWQNEIRTEWDNRIC